MEADHLIKRRHTPVGYRISDTLSEPLIFFLVLFGPWAFGTTQTWAIWVTNVTGYLLGGLLLVKWYLRWHTGCRPTRWNSSSYPPTEAKDNRREEALQPLARGPSRLVVVLGILTVFILGYCLVSAVNARATYHPPRHYLEFHPAILWLPHSFDSPRTWQVFWQYLGLACAFWAIRDWLMGLSPIEIQRQSLTYYTNRSGFPSDQESTIRDNNHRRRNGKYSLFPARLHRLLLVLSLNGALLAGEGIVQRLSGTDKLLWLKRPRYESNQGQFGPYSYRSNAVQYLNLIWPVSAAYAWTLARQASRAKRHGFQPFSRAFYWLPMSAILMASSSVISGSRGGTFVATLQLVFLGFVLLTSARHMRWSRKLGLLAFLLLAVQVAVYLGWDYLGPRLKGSIWEQYQIRQQTVLENTAQMTKDFPWLGTGPGTFAWLYQFYFEAGDYWLAHVHNDWLETRITFGWLGLALVLLGLLPVGLHWFLGRGMPVPGVLAASISIALAGCLVEAWIDFPLQVHSILSLFLVLCGVLFSSRNPQSATPQTALPEQGMKNLA